MVYVESQVNCQTAASALGLGDTRANVRSYSTSVFPPFCSFIAGYELELNGADSTTSCSSLKQCVCGLAVPSPPPSPLVPGGFALVTSGSCRSAGMDFVTTTEECKSAASALGLYHSGYVSDQAYMYSGRGKPPFCYSQNSGYNYHSLYLNGPEYVDPTYSYYSTGSCSAYYQCICGMATPSPPAPPRAPGGYALVTFGSCSDAGMGYVTTVEECRSASSALGMGSNWVSTSSSSEVPPACYSVYGNTYLGPAGSTAKCSSRYQCICGPSPPPAPPGYAVITTGSCLTAGMGYITTQYECTYAASRVGLVYRSFLGDRAYSSGPSGVPPFCHSAGWSYYYLYLSTGYGSCSTEYKCICGPAPSPPPPPPLPPSLFRKWVVY
jgi:hypothetical protein